MNENSLPIAWVGALTFIFATDRTLTEEFIDSEKLERDPVGRTIIGLFLAVALPYLLLLLLILLNLIVGIWSLLGFFVLSLISTFVPFYLISGLTYIFAKLLGGQENYSTHSYLLSLIYAPLTLISLSLTFLLTLIFGQISLSCLNILGIGILILTFIGMVKILRYGQELSIGRSVIAAGLTSVASLSIAACVGVILVTSGTIDPASLPSNVAATRDAKMQATATRQAATLEAIVTRKAEKRATSEAHPIGGVLIPRSLGDFQSASFSPDGSKFVTTSQQVIVWDTASLKEIADLSSDLGFYPVTGLSYSPDGLKLAASNDQGLIEIWDTQTWQEVARLENPTREKNKIYFSPDGQKLMTVESSRLVVWNVNTKEQLYTITAANDTDMRSATFSPDGNHIAASIGPRVQLWEAETGEEVTGPEFDEDANILIT